MKVYLAANYASRVWLRDIAELLEANGIQVTCRWIFGNADNLSRQQEANQDLTDIDRCDAILLFIDQYGEIPGRGKFVEFGYAIAKDKELFLIGHEMGCVFYELSNVVKYNNVTTFIGEMKKRNA